jgi:hypothetical protein
MANDWFFPMGFPIVAVTSPYRLPSDATVGAKRPWNSPDSVTRLKGAFVTVAEAERTAPPALVTITE